MTGSAAPLASSVEPTPVPVSLKVVGEPARVSANVFLYGALALEMREIRRLIEELGERLVEDPVFIEKYLVELQRFDLMVQRMEEAASLLDRMAGGSMAHDAIKAVRLTAMQSRLREALIGK